MKRRLLIEVKRVSRQEPTKYVPAVYVAKTPCGKTVEREENLSLVPLVNYEITAELMCRQIGDCVLTERIADNVFIADCYET